MAYNSYGQIQRQQQQQPPQNQYSNRQYAGLTLANLPGRQPQRQDIPYRSDNGGNGQVVRAHNGMLNGHMLDANENIHQDYKGHNGHVGPEHQGHWQEQGRVYHYDERFHSEGNGSSRQNGGYQGGGGGGGGDVQAGDTRRRAQSRPRERILDRPTSPELVAWDNPFPTFNPKKKPNRKNHSSLDKDLSNLNLHQTNAADPRPHTSQGTRPRADSRPSTAHGYRQHDRDPLPDPPLPSQQRPMSPLRKDPPRGFDRGYESDGQQWGSDHTKGPMRPELNPLHSNSYEQTPNRSRRQPFSEPQQPIQRSMTMPENVTPTEYQRAGPYHSAANPYWPEPERPNHNGGQRVRPQPPPYVESSQQGLVAARSRSNGAGQLATPNGHFHQGSYMDHQVPQHGNGSERKFVQNDGLEDSGVELPRFDAIAAAPSEKFEDHLQPLQSQNHPQLAYTKKTYQPPQQARPQPHHNQGQINATQESESLQSPLAEFQFDLTPGRHRAPNDQNDTIMQSHIPGQPMPKQRSGSNRPYDQYQQQYGYEDYHQPGPGRDPTARFPSRDASRPQVHPQSAQDLHQYPAEETPIRQDYTQQQPPFNNYDRSYDRARPEGPPRGVAAHDQPAYADRGQPSSLRNYEGANDQPYGGNSRPGRLQGDLTQEAYNFDVPQTLPAATSSHPPPVRHYDQRSASGSVPSPASRPIGPRSPDSLPMHPTPVRPGLMKNHADNPHGSQDGRGQQQVRTANPPQSVSSAATAPPSSTNGKQKSPPVTPQELSVLQQQVLTNPNDHATALKLAQKLEEAVSVLANEGGRADAKTTARNREKYSFDAHKLLKKLAGASYPEAMFYLADCHGQGKLGLAVDPREAFSLYQSAAKLNHPQSAYRVAVCCEMGAEEGGGTRRDPLKAMQWYKRAATLGDTPAMYKMGMILLKGLLGQPKNPREALFWLKRAAERADEDNPHALHELGLLYESDTPNDAIIRDENYSRQLFTQAADLGYKYSQFRLGSAYEYGMLGCPVDARQSIAWYSRAAAQGEHQSELALSGWYLTGAEGLVQQSDTEAYLWARKAAISGLAKAEYAMGYFTEVGIGGPANLEEAKRWYWRAASQNFPQAKERLDDLNKGGGKMPKTRVSRSAVGKQSEGECSVM